MSSKLIGADSEFFSKMVVDAANAIKMSDGKGGYTYPIKAVNVLNYSTLSIFMIFATFFNFCPFFQFLSNFQFCLFFNFCPFLQFLSIFNIYPIFNLRPFINFVHFYNFLYICQLTSILNLCPFFNFMSNSFNFSILFAFISGIESSWQKCSRINVGRRLCLELYHRRSTNAAQHQKCQNRLFGLFFAKSQNEDGCSSPGDRS